MKRLLFILLGVLVSFGGMALFRNPVFTLVASGFMIGIESIMKGVSWLLISSEKKKLTNERSTIAIIYGVLSLILGTIFIMRPVFAAKVFVIMVAMWLLMDGIMGLLTISLHTGKWKSLSVILNILLIIMGIYLFANPAVAAITAVFVVASSVVIMGILLIILGFTLEK